MTVLFLLYTKGGNLIHSSERQYDFRTAESVIDKDYEEWKAARIEEMFGGWEDQN
jgi:hypothetical protein